MTDPYNTFDTFTVGSESEPAMPEPPKVPPILARLPKIKAAPPKPPTRQRFDDAESPLPEAHLSESYWESTDTFSGPPASLDTGALPTATIDNPTETIRIDTVSPGVFDARANPATQAASPSEDNAPATIPFTSAAAPSATTEFQPTVQSADEPWTAWMLDIESTIQPYARWIALAAVIAALGLTIVLLRGGGEAIDANEIPSQVLTDNEADQALVGDYETGNAPPLWPAGVAAETVETTPAGIDAGYAELGLRPLDDQPSASTPPLVAAGPASAARAPSAARLTGEVLPGESSRINVADAKYNTGTPGTIR